MNDLHKQIKDLRAENNRLKKKIEDNDQGYNLKLFNFGTRKSFFKSSKSTQNAIVLKMRNAFINLNTNFACAGMVLRLKEFKE